MNAQFGPLMWSASAPREETTACWTRMQSEAGQDLGRIVARKETERRVGDGVFFWGVGNPPATAAAPLARMHAMVPVLFSIMKTKPKAGDVSPERVVAWRRFVDSDGALRDLPAHVLVTSRLTRRACHYALVCRSETPIGLGDLGPFDTADWRNLGGTGAPIGASQVTALIRRVGDSNSGDYRIAMRAYLTGGYWVKLVDPVEVSAADRATLESAPDDRQGWLSLANKIKQSPGEQAHKALAPSIAQYGLFTV